MDAIARTAYYCCGVRAADAEKRVPIIGDHLAQLFMDAEGQEVYRRFAEFRFPNASNAARARIIDDWLRDRLLAEPDLRVILLGAGFDTRGFRLNGGNWIELDQPALIEKKNALLPADRAPNPVQRIEIDFATEKLEDKLKPFDGERPVIVMEGVTMYLGQPEIRRTLSTLQYLFPSHTLMCDLMTKSFFTRYVAGKFHDRIKELGGKFAELPDDPARNIAGLGYRELSRISMVKRARELGAVPIPMFVLNTFLRPLRDGYCAYVFDTKGR